MNSGGGLGCADGVRYQEDEEFYARKERRQRESREAKGPKANNGIDGKEENLGWRVAKEAQVVELEFAKVCADSGAGKTVCPISAFPNIATRETGNVGGTYRAVGGQQLVDVR